MLQFNELRITPDSNYIIIDVSVINDSYYQDICIDSIVIDTQDTYISNGPSNNPIFVYQNGSIDFEDFIPVNTLDEEGANEVYVVDSPSFGQVYVKENSYYIFDETAKHLRLVLSTKDLKATLKDNMFFVYAIATGTPSPETPCGFDNPMIMGTVVNLYPAYRKSIYYMKELNNECNIPRGFIDTILRYKALELCIRTGNYPQAIKYWRRFFADIDTEIPNYKCSCYGTVD